MIFINFFSAINAKDNIKKNKVVNNMLIILSFIILSFISVSLFLKSNILFNNADMSFHFRRIIELRQSILNANIFPMYSFNNFHGSAAMLFYPYLNLYPIVFLSFIIKSKITLIYVFYMFNTFLSFIIGYYSCNNYIHSKYTAYLFSLIYSLSNMFLGYYFSIMDLGMVSAYVFLPISIFGFMNIIKGENNWLELSLGMSLLFFSHILSFLVVAIFLVVLLIINLDSFNKYLFIKLLKAAIIFIMVTGVVLIPFINLYFHNFNQILMPPSAQHLNRISLKTIVSGLYGAKKADTLGTFAIISIFISIFFYKKFDHIIKQLYILSLVIVLSTLFFPWEFMSYGIFKIVNQFQTTYRFLIIPQLLLTFIFTLIITQYIKLLRKKYIIYILTIIFTLLLQFMAQYTFVNTASKSPSIDHYINTNKMALGNNYKITHSYQIDSLLNEYPDFETTDYIPKNSNKFSYFVNRNKGLYDNKQILINNSKYNEFTFSNVNNINELSLPIYIYNKEKLNVYLNNKLVNDYTNKDGLLTINNVKPNNNKIHIKLVPDLSKIIGIILSTIGLILILILMIRKKLNNR